MTGPADSAQRPTVVVVGGGIAGLAAAWELVTTAPGARVVVLEGSARLGGKITSDEFGGRVVDLGPDAFVARRPEAAELCRAIGLGDDLVAPGARSAYLWSGGRLHPLPAGLALGVPTRLGPLAGSGILSPGGLGHVAADLLSPPWRAGSPEDDEAIGGLLRRRVGAEVVDKLADPLIGGIHAGSVDHLSAAAVFPPLLEAARRPGSLVRNLRREMPGATSGATSGGGDETPVFLTVRGGLARLVDTLAAALEARGAEISTGQPVRTLERQPGSGWTVRVASGDGPSPIDTSAVDADAVVVAVPAPAAADVLADTEGQLSSLLRRITYSSVVLVTLRFARADVGDLPDGTGYLVPRSGDALLTACTWLSTKWPQLARDDDVLVRVSAGHHGDDRPDALDDDELVRRALDELGPAIGCSSRPLETRVTRFPDAFPQYEVGHLAWVDQLERAAARVGRLGVAGALLRGVGIPACIASGRQAARAALADLAGTSAP